MFDSAKVIVIFVLGGPGSGKGTQCARLVEDFGFCHLSAGDLLRAEQHREGAPFAELIQTCIKEGAIVPTRVTVRLLENAIIAAMQERRTSDGWAEDRGRFIIDGFPRKMDQALYFEEHICQSSLVLNLVTTEEVMLARILERGKTSGREDDNVESIKKRFLTHKEQTIPVIEYYASHHKAADIDSTGTVEEVHKKICRVIEPLLSK